jgi:hypothetical protein
MQMRDRPHEDIAIVDRVNQPVGEPAEAVAANALSERMPSLWKAHDPVRGGEYLNQKRITQTRRLILVPAGTA